MNREAACWQMLTFSNEPASATAIRLGSLFERLEKQINRDGRHRQDPMNREVSY